MKDILQTKMTNKDHPLDRGWAWMVAVAGMMNMFIVVGFINVTGYLFIDMIKEFHASHTAVSVIVGVKEAIFSVAAGMMNMFIVVGFINVTGYLFIDMIKEFHASHTAVSVIVGVKEAIFSVAALFTLGVVSDIIHTRIQIMLGGVLLSLGYSLSYFATTIEHMLVYSVFVGLGLSLAYFQNLVVVTRYFDHWKTVAMGLTTSGVSLGTIVLPFLMEYLLTEYSLKGCLLIMGGIFLHVTMFGALMHPPDFYNHRTIKHKPTNNNEIKPVLSPLTSSDPLTSSIPLTSSEPETSNDVVMIPAEEASLMNTMPRIIPVIMMSHSTPPTISHDTPTMSHSTPHGSKSENDLLYPASSSNASLALKVHSDPISMHYVKTHPNVQQHLKVSYQQLKSGFSTNSLYFDEFFTKFDASDEDNHRSYHPILKSSRKSFHIIDKKLLTDLAYMSYMISVSLCQTANSMTFIFIAPLMEETMHNLRDISILFAIFGVFNFVFKFIFGYLADMEIMPRYRMSIITCVLLGVLSNLLSFFTNFHWLLLYMMAQGSLIACFFVTTPVIMIDFFGRKVQSRSMGISILLTGVTNLALAPILGYMRDVTGSFAASFNVIGSLFILGAAILGFVTIPLLKQGSIS